MWSTLADRTHRWGAAVRHRIVSPPTLGLAVITPLVLAGAVSASPPREATTTAVTPLAAVLPAPAPDPIDGPSVVPVKRPPGSFHVAVAAASAPPPPQVVRLPGMLGIPGVALTAYRNAERMMAEAVPDCGISWNLLAGIGRIESGHANGGATDTHGTAIVPIYGPSLDGTLPGNEVIVQSNGYGRVTYARAMGPMQFLPGTWSRYAADGDGDGKADPQNVFDATLAAGRYLCSGGLNLRDRAQVTSAILRYNNSMAYTQNVLGWAAAYATGVFPTDLPPILGPAPPIADAHFDTPHGLGPGLPAFDAKTDQPLAHLPLIEFGQPWGAPQSPVTGQPPLGPHQPAACSVICIGEQPPPQPLFPWMAPPPPMAPPPAPARPFSPQALPPAAGPPPAPAAPPGVPPGAPAGAPPGAPGAAPPGQPLPPQGPAPAGPPAQAPGPAPVPAG